jgi:ABC-type transport system involved in multi-copper enzyme maturation permease subunit
MSQTIALLLDAYRDLNSRKMFWIVLILSALVAASFAALGLTPYGVKLFVWEIPSPFYNSRMLDPGDFYKQIFLNYGIEFWLTWLATCLALISTASVFPDFIAGGAIDLYLSKPISRLRLFLTKYLCGLLFVALQIACFCLASVLVIGIRGRVWEPGIFLAVPIVVLFFSYLYCFCVLIGVLTRSTVAAVLLSLLFWIVIYGVHKTEVTLLTLQLYQHDIAARLDQQIPATENSLAQARKTAATRPSTRLTNRIASLENRLDDEQSNRAARHDQFDRAHTIFYFAMTVLPKTSETVELLERELIKKARLQNVAAQNNEDVDTADTGVFDSSNAALLQHQVELAMRGRSVTWVIGTSVIGETVILVLAAWIFCRRDY